MERQLQAVAVSGADTSPNERQAASAGPKWTRQLSENASKLLRMPETLSFSELLAVVELGLLLFAVVRSASSFTLRLLRKWLCISRTLKTQPQSYQADNKLIYHDFTNDPYPD
jgi:hypothetical protein